MGKNCCKSYKEVYQSHLVYLMVWFAYILLFGLRYPLRNMIQLQLAHRAHYYEGINNTLCTRQEYSNRKQTNMNFDIPDWDWVGERALFFDYSYHIGYMMSEIPLGILCDLYGARHFISLGLLASGIINTVLVFTLHKTMWIHTVMLVFLNGLVHGSCAPSASSLLGRWVPRSQSTFIISAVYSGVPIGRAFSGIVSVYFTINLNYWRGSFYFWAGMVVLWYIFFVNTVFSTASTHPYYSGQEIKEFGGANPCRIPWKSILLDCALWAVISAQIGHKVLLTATELSLPVFTMGLFNINIFLAPQYALIQLSVILLILYPISFLGDYLINREIVPTVYLRSIYVIVGNILASFFQLLATFMSCHKVLTVVCNLVGIMCGALLFSGLSANVIDRTRYFAGFFTGIADTMSTVTTTISAQLFLKINKKNNMSGWSKVYWFCLATCIFTTVIYLMWCKGERAKYDVVETKEQVLQKSKVSKKRSKTKI